MFNAILQKVIGTQNTRTLTKLQPIVDQINSYEESIKKLTDGELKMKTDEFKDRLQKGETLDDILPESFAVVREAAIRVLKMRHYDVQLIGGIVLHQGKIAEMSTGEGKTLTSTLAVYLNAIEGKGVHVVTVNDYLATRDRDWMGPVFEFLGLTVGAIYHDMDPEERQAAYRSDITYGTNNEFGFDYLRDNMVSSLEQRSQRELNYCIIDEVDSILVDEARTPLIISGPAEESTDKYFKAYQAMKFLKGYMIEQEEYDPEWKEKLEELKKEYDYISDEKAKTVRLTETGENKAAKFMGVDNMHDFSTIEERHQIITAIRAQEFFKKDVDYVVKDDEIIIVDEFTGRLMPGRRFSDGLHQALEAKEGVEIRRENQTLATVTFQNYFRMYDKLSGMTGTAATEAVEFEKIYKLDVVVIPTNKPCIRDDRDDSIYRTQQEKFDAVINEVYEEHERGRPVLVGTISIETSEKLSSLLTKRNIVHTVLNAKYHEKEAEIISKAGQPGAVTIATNMAGRGTDIVLGEGVADKGGLAVIGTERHESRRIDNQLRGRCGRQGDPGSSKFFVALDDQLMRLFGSDRIAFLMDKMGMEEGMEIQHPMVSSTLEKAQKRVEGHNFEIRKHLLEYDDVMNRQRELVYNERDQVLRGEGLKEHIFEMLDNVVEDIVIKHVNPDVKEHEKDMQTFANELGERLNSDYKLIVEDAIDYPDILVEEISKKARLDYEEKESKMGVDKMRYLEKYLLLQIIDGKWKEHLYALDHLKDGIHLRAYGQKDPLVEYKREAFDLFEYMTAGIKHDAVTYLYRVQIVNEEEKREKSHLSKAEFLHPESQGMPEGSTQVDSPAAPGMGPGGQQAPPVHSAQPKAKPIRRNDVKVGRNDPCPCGSGKKYKKCCGK